MAKAKKSFLGIKAFKKFSKLQTLTLAALTIFAGLVVGVVYGASQSDDCIIGQVYTWIDGVETEINQYGSCDGSDGSSDSDSDSDSDNDSDGSGGSGGSQPAQPSGRITCKTLSDSKIRWSAVWRNANAKVEEYRGSTAIHRFRGVNGPVTGSATWTETGLSAKTAYKGVLKNGSTRLAGTQCNTKAAPVVPEEEHDDPIADMPRDEDDNVRDTFCNGNLCTTSRKTTGTRGTSATTSSDGSKVTATVCNSESACSTYTTVSDDPDVKIAQSTECTEGTCTYKVYEDTPPTGVRGFFIRLYLKVNGFFKNLL